MNVGQNSGQQDRNLYRIDRCAIFVLAPSAVESIGGLFTQVPRRRPTAPVTDPRTLEDDAGVQYNTAPRIHNEKDVRIGLLELCMAFHGGQEKLMELRPDASIRYMGIQEVQKLTPFEAATLPAQEVVVIWIYGNINGPEKLAKLRQ